MGTLEVNMSWRDGSDPFLYMMRGLVYLGNLNPNMTPDHIFMIGRNFGQINWIYMVRDATGTWLGHTYVMFKDDQAATEFVAYKEGLAQWNGGNEVQAKISCMKAGTRFIDAGIIIVQGLAEQTTVEMLQYLFEVYGKIRKIQIPDVTPKTAFIEFETEWAAYNSISVLLDEDWNGETLYLNFKANWNPFKEQREKRMSVLVYNVPFTMRSAELEKNFLFIGDIVARVHRSADGTSLGTGYVKFEIPADDTPLLSCYASCETVPDNYSLVPKGYTEHFRSTRAMPVLPNKVRFHPSAVPPEPLGRYVVPEHHRSCLQLLDDCIMSPDSELSQFLLGAFHLHVSNLGTLTRDGLIKVFSDFGTVQFCTVQIEKKTKEKYAIVTFKDYEEARRAVHLYNTMRSDKSTVGKGILRVELIDIYFLHHHRNAARLSKMKSAESSDLTNSEQGTAAQALSPSAPSPKMTPEKQGIRKRKQADNTPRVPSLESMQEQDNIVRPIPIPPGTAIPYFPQHGFYPPYLVSKCPNYTETLEQYRSAAPASEESQSYLYRLYLEQCGVIKNMPEPQEQFRAQVRERVSRFYPKSTEAERAAMVEVALEQPLIDLNDMLAFDHTFRGFFIRRSLEAAVTKNARNKK